MNWLDEMCRAGKQVFGSHFDTRRAGIHASSIIYQGKGALFNLFDGFQKMLPI